MKRYSPYIYVVIFAMLYGCATVPLTTPSLDAEGKKFNTEQGKANIYVQRSGGIFGGPVLIFQLMLDGRFVGAIAPDTYHLLSVQPGEYTIAVMGTGSYEQVKLKVEQGKNYFCKVVFAIGPLAYIESISEEEGKKLVLESMRAETTNYK